jgi:hypothetical protein
MMKTLNVTRNKSLEWSLGIHAGLLLLGFMPLLQKQVQVEPKEYIIEFGYEEIPETTMSGSEGLQARSPIFNEEPEPTTDSPEKDPIPVDAAEPVKEITLAEDVSELESDVVMESDVDVIASEEGNSGSDAETHADGGGSGSPLEGDQDGAAMAGDGGAGDGLEGDGIITRRIIYHENISRLAKENGRIVLNICINRQGRVEYVGYDADKTTIIDKATIREATLIASRYRFEENYSAPKRECGQLTFIFTVQQPVAVE